MNRLLYSTILLSSWLYSAPYKIIFEKNIQLDKQTTSKLTLLQENRQDSLEKPAKIEISSLDGQIKYYSFQDNDKDFSIQYFDKLKLNTQISELVNLESSINIFDVDNNGKNEIFIYGESYKNSGDSVGKILILEQKNKKIIQKTPMIKAYNNYEIKYYPSEDLIILAQNIQRFGLESRLGDSYTYQFYIYDIKDNFKKLPILLSKKKLNSNDNNLIDKNLNQILKRYHEYKKGDELLALAEDYEMMQFVKKYWQNIAKNNLEFVATLLKDKVLYYSKQFSKSDIIKDKKRALKKVKNINFTLKDFLVYKNNNKYHVEYTKSYSTDEHEVSGTVKSLMVLERINNKIYVHTEKDIKVLALGSDGK